MEEIYCTGATGFIGSHLIKRLDGCKAIPHQEIQNFNSTFDKFYFLSAYGNMATHTDYSQIMQANVLDVLRVLSPEAIKQNFSSFVYLSSSSVSLKKQTMYSRTKKAAEELLLGLMEVHDLPITIIRPFSVTGVGEQPAHLIPKLIHSCMTGERMDFVPRPIHDFIDVDDVVEGILTLSRHHAKGVFELGTGEGISNVEVLRMVEEATGKKANVRVIDSMRDYDTKDWMSGNFTARRYGWRPKKTLQQSINEMVEAYNAAQ